MVEEANVAMNLCGKPQGRDTTLCGVDKTI